MSKSILLDCPKCGRKFGIAAASGTVHVTCPSCREQWDWPRRRAPALGAKWRTAKDSSGPFLKKAAFWAGAFLFPSRFSGIQVIVALVAGMGIGVMLGDKIAVRKMASEPDSVAVAVPTVSGTNYQGTAKGLNTNGIVETDDETFPTNVLKPEPAKTN